MANDTPPSGAPFCWGRQYDDASKECRACSFNASCKPATINNYPNQRQYTAPATLPQPRHLNGSSLPVMPMIGQQPSAFPRTFPMQPPQPTQVQQPHFSYQPAQPQPHAPMGWNNPAAYLHRPAPPPPVPQQGPWWQYSGETTASRLGKNILLSIGRAIVVALMDFFFNWTWPTKEDRR